MKKLIAFALTICLSMSLMACGGNDDTTKAPENNQQTENSGSTSTPQGYLFAVDGQEIYIGMAQDDMKALLGESANVFEAPSCAGQGIDYTYTYSGGSVEIVTVPDANGVNRIDAILLKDDLISTPEGLSLGMTLSDVTGAYGDNYTTNGSAHIYSKDNMQLQFILDGEEIISIQYVVVE